MQRLFRFPAIATLFLMSACDLFLPVDPQTPILSETSVSQVFATGATVQARIENLETKNSRQEKKSGGIVEYGFVYATQDKPTVENGTAVKIGDNVATTPFDFITQINNLSTQATYYVRAYAKNEGGGAGYGPATAFKTGEYILPTINIAGITNVTNVSADVNVTIVSAGTSGITSFGVCYSGTNSSPTIFDGKVEINSKPETGNYTASLTGLSSGTTYNVRTYANSTGGLIYGRTLTFTLGEPTPFTNKKSFTMNYSNPYDLDLGELVSQFGAEDLNWYPYNDVAGIYPKNGAKFAVLGQLNFDNVKYSDITKAVLTTDFINGSYTDTRANKLTNGTVIAYITNQGRYGKMSIDAHGENRAVGGSTGGDMQVTILTYNK